MTSTLGLDDDLDSVELVRNVEAAFDLRIPNEDAVRMETVGDLYDWLVHNIDPRCSGNKCASAMVFYRLRRAIQRLGFAPDRSGSSASELRKLTPATSLAFLEGHKLKANLANLAKETGFQIPKAVPTRVTFFGVISAGVLFAVALANEQFLSRISVFFPSLVLIALFGWKIVLVDRGKLPKQCSTLGELTKTVALRNCGRLVKMGARHGPSEIWENLLDLLSVYDLPRSDITRGTVFLQSQLKTPGRSQRANAA